MSGQNIGLQPPFSPIFCHLIKTSAWWQICGCSLLLINITQNIVSTQKGPKYAYLKEKKYSNYNLFWHWNLKLQKKIMTFFCTPDTTRYMLNNLSIAEWWHWILKVWRIPKWFHESFHTTVFWWKPYNFAKNMSLL